MTLAECQSEPRIAGVNAFQPVVLRRTVRLDPFLAQALDEHCRASGEAPSSVIRAAVRLELARSKPADMMVVSEKTPRPLPAAENPGNDNTVTQQEDRLPRNPLTRPTAEALAEFPMELVPLCRALRSFGAATWTERKARFLSVIALSQNCSELSAEPRDAAMLADFLAVAKKYGMLPQIV